MSTHPMVTRAKAGIFKPLEHMNFHVTTTSPLPRSHVHSLRDPNWKEAMCSSVSYFTRPDFSYVVQQVCLYMHDPHEPHFNALKRILRYVRGTVNYGLQLHVSSTAQLTAYTDVDWVVCCNTSIIHIAVEAKYEVLLHESTVIIIENDL
ncbi:ribonuclease H-like domain-containing protein [Tanacetum coccineum]